MGTSVQLGGKMGSRRRPLNPVGPFGNPDGSRADIEDVISEFVDFGGNPAYGHVATRANDSMVRVIVVGCQKSAWPVSCGSVRPGRLSQSARGRRGSPGRGRGRSLPCR